MAQNRIKPYTRYEWDSSCIKAEEFLNGLRTEFRDKTDDDMELVRCLSKVIGEHIGTQLVLLQKRKLCAMYGALVAFSMTGKTNIKHLAYDVVRNMWAYMDNICMTVYMELPSDRERINYLDKKGREFMQWYSLNSGYDIWKYLDVLRKVLHLTLVLRFEDDENTRLILLILYVSFNNKV